MLFKEVDYVKGETAKTNIIIHGSNWGTSLSNCEDLDTINVWRNAGKMGYHYLVATDGTVHEVFPEKYWAVHLVDKENISLEPKTITICVANEGPLQKDDKNYVWCNNPFKGTTLTLEKGWCGYNHFAMTTLEQDNAVAKLVNDICKRYKFSKTYCGSSEVIPQIAERATVMMHSALEKSTVDFPIDYFGPFLAELGFELVDCVSEG